MTTEKTEKPRVSSIRVSEKTLKETIGGLAGNTPQNARVMPVAEGKAAL